mgnify:CR=1 FL=1
MAIFNKDFYTIENETLRLELIETNEGNEKALPFYWWKIILKEINKEIGKISLRIGHNYHSYFNGNVGYEIDSEYRGHNYAYKACELIIPVAKYHGMNFIYITCDFDNIPSIKTIEKLGAEFLEEVIPPKDYVFYFDGISSHKIYKLSIK